MAISFPVNPTDGQEFVASSDLVFVYNSSKSRWSSKSFAQTESKFEQIKTSLDYLGVDISTVSLDNVAEVIKTHSTPVYTEKVQVVEEYVRPSDWISMPAMTASDEKFVGLFAVIPNDTNVAYIYCQGAYTVDWGDGTVEDFASGAYAEKAYDFSTFDTSDSTLTSRGYKQALITVTPQDAQSIVTFHLHNTPPNEKDGSIMNWLDIKLSLPNCTNFHINTTGGRFSKLLESVDILNVNDVSMYYWFNYCNSLKKVRIKNSAQVSSIYGLFQLCTSLQKIDLFDVDTSLCTTFTATFNSCYNLIELPDMDISNGTSFSTFLGSCYLIQRVPTSYTFDNAISMSSAFTNCRSLLEMPTINSTSVTSYNNCFNSCVSMSKVPDQLNTSSCTDFRSMFVSNFSMKIPPRMDTSSGVYFDSMFSACTSLDEIPFTLDTSSATRMPSMFSSCYSLRKIPEGLVTDSCTVASSIFQDCRSIEEVPYLNTANITSFYRFYLGCYNLKSVPSQDYSSGTNFVQTFSGCSKLEQIPDMTTTGLGLDFESMFNGCISLKNAPKINLSSANEVNSMFYSCYSLEEFNASDYDFSNPFNFQYMFRYCSGLKKINGSLNMSNATDVFGIFEYCFALQDIDVSIPSQNSCNYERFISDCRSIKSISNLDLQNATSLNLFAVNAFSLTNISNVTNIDQNIDLRNTNLNASDFVDLFTNSLSTVSGKTILINGSPGATQLTAEQIAVATNKGWTVTV